MWRHVHRLVAAEGQRAVAIEEAPCADEPPLAQRQCAPDLQRAEVHLAAGMDLDHRSIVNRAQSSSKTAPGGAQGRPSTVRMGAIVVRLPVKNAPSRISSTDGARSSMVQPCDSTHARTMPGNTPVGAVMRVVPRTAKTFVAVPSRTFPSGVTNNASSAPE